MDPAVGELDWANAAGELDEVGVARLGPLLSPAQCEGLKGLYPDDGRFRSTVDMAQHRFGQGQYRYFDYPLPDLVEQLRRALWPHLLPLARSFAARLDRPSPWPDDLQQWLASCHQAGQTKPTPLLLRYGPGDWNALHRDLYGELVFPLQVIVGLDRPGQDYDGGELMVVEQRPRAQSRATAISIGFGEAVVVTTAEHPINTPRGWSAAPVRHGVSVVRRGRRHTLGLLFHDAT
ncbi:MAG: 2OG-Fe(II) oxygenase [Acidimicrobiales bacterium]